MSWYRKYRPRTVAGLHLTSVRESLLEMLKQGNLPQVMLFAGPKGTGKTSTARIIGAVLNDPANEAAVKSIFFKSTDATTSVLLEPSAEGDWADKIFNGASYLVQELDAASNRGIDDVRQLRERVSMPPQEGVMSVYILDEAHMLTTEAFNALLKLLEEPPPHAVFILATTEKHKIPETIISRCTVFSFTKATATELQAALETVLNQEKVTFDPEAVLSLAAMADGSFRDAIKMLEQACAGVSHLDQETVSRKISGVSETYVQQLTEAVTAKDASGVAELFAALRIEGMNQDFFFKQLVSFLHTELLKNLGVVSGKTKLNQATALFLLQELQAIPSISHSLIPFLPLELKLLDLVFRAQQKQSKGSDPSSGSQPAKVETVKVVQKKTETLDLDDDLPETFKTTAIDMVPDAVSVIPSLSLAVGKSVVSDNLQPVKAGDSAKLLDHWEAFIDLVTLKNSSVAALLRTAKPMSSEGDKVVIAVFYKFHQEQLQQPKFRKMIDEVIEPLTGGKIALEFVLSQPPTQTEDSSLTSMAEELLV